MKNILNILQILTGLLVIAAYGFIAIKTAFFGVAAVCWLGVALGAWHMFDGVKNVIIKK